MSNFKDWIETLRSGESWDVETAAGVARWIADESADASEKESLLIALTERGEQAADLAGFATAFREMAVTPEGVNRADEAIDVCGTGGDHSGSFNISTAVGFLLASLEVPVFKHGNRSITSQCGSADILEGVGWPLHPDSAQRKQLLDNHHFTFFFAPEFHPAFRVVGPIRKSLAEQGRRTIFNLLGPLLNPGRPAHQLIGVMGPDKVELVADALSNLGIKRGLVVHCQLPNGKGLDEASTAGDNLGMGSGALKEVSLSGFPPRIGLPEGSLGDLKGGDRDENLKILENLAQGRVRGTLADTVALNAGLALWVAGRSASPAEGVEAAARQLRDGGIHSWLRNALS